MLRRVEKIFLTLLMTTVLAEASELPVLQGIKELYGWQQQYDPAAAEKSFERDAAQGDLCSSGMSLLIKRRKTASVNASELDNDLRRHITLLVGKIARQPDVLSCFVLSELLDDPVSPERDRELAFWLCKYSAEKNFPPAQLKLAIHLINNPANSNDLAVAANLLHKAAETIPAMANWQLYLLGKQYGDNSEADKFLQTAAGYSLPEALIEQACLKKSLTREIAGLSGRGQYLYAMDHTVDREDKIDLCYKSSGTGYAQAALFMAVLYLEQLHNDHFMSFNAAVLAHNLQSGDRRPLQLMQELDNRASTAMALLAMWQNQLKTGIDLRRAKLADSDLHYDLFINADTPEIRQRLEKALLSDTEAFYLSGTVFQLKKYKFTYQQIKTLLLKTPPQKDMLPILIAQLLIAGENCDSTWQLELSGKLLAHLAQKYQHLKLERPGYRLKLAAVLPGAAKLEQPFAFNAESTVVMTWNLAVNMRVNALLAAGKKAAAEKFLKKYMRFKLPGVLKNMERNMVKRFAPELIRKPAAAAGK